MYCWYFCKDWPTSFKSNTWTALWVTADCYLWPSKDNKTDVFDIAWHYMEWPTFIWVSNQTGPHQHHKQCKDASNVQHSLSIHHLLEIFNPASYLASRSVDYISVPILSNSYQICTTVLYHQFSEYAVSKRFSTSF